MIGGAIFPLRLCGEISTERLDPLPISFVLVYPWHGFSFTYPPRLP
jgi:hypothetical protein